MLELASVERLLPGVAQFSLLPSCELAVGGAQQLIQVLRQRGSQWRKFVHSAVLKYTELCNMLLGEIV